MYVGANDPAGISLLGHLFGVVRKPVNVVPGSEYWLEHSDPRGAEYREGPAKYGIEFNHWCP